MNAYTNPNYNTNNHQNVNNKYSHTYSDLSSQARSQFINKVYTILSIQLTFTVLAVLLNMYSRTFAYIQQQYTILTFVAFIGTIVPLLLLISPTYSRKSPTNLYCLAIFTLCQSYVVSRITSLYTPESVLLSALATCAATFGITFYAMTTKTDFTKWMHSFYAFASGVFWVVLFVSIFGIFLRVPFVNMGIAFLIAVIYCGYILVDTQLILGGKNKELTLDNHMMGAIILYVDIIGLFLKILQILGEKKNDRRK